MAIKATINDMPERITIRILILDTADNKLSDLHRAFEKAIGPTSSVSNVSSGDELLSRLRMRQPYNLVVLDYFLGDGVRSGLDILRDIRSFDGQLPVVLVAEKGNVEMAKNAVRAGATDFLVRGPNLEERVFTQLGKLRKFIALFEQNRILDEINLRLREAEHDKYRIIGKSPAILDVIMRINRVASIPRPVLICGERGTGKELAARAIHSAAGPPGRPFVVVNCASVPDTLLESELFGHEKGAFTGAERKVMGKFEQADGGTIFFDEIGNMSLPFQQKILRVVEYKYFTRVGGTAEIKINTRIISATNADLETKMRNGGFLRDLYDRLAFEVINVPPLSEREGDVEVLTEYFMNCFMNEVPAFQGKIFSRKALELLNNYRFPGNVRELKNIIERAVYRDTTNELTPEDIGFIDAWPEEISAGSFRESVENLERKLITEALAKSGGNQAEAARNLGLSYHQFRYYYRKYIKSGPGHKALRGKI